MPTHTRAPPHCAKAKHRNLEQVKIESQFVVSIITPSYRPWNAPIVFVLKGAPLVVSKIHLGCMPEFSQYSRRIFSYCRARNSGRVAQHAISQVQYWNFIALLFLMTCFTIRVSDDCVCLCEVLHFLKKIRIDVLSFPQILDRFCLFVIIRGVLCHFHLPQNCVNYFYREV